MKYFLTISKLGSMSHFILNRLNVRTFFGAMVSFFLKRR
ncbi:hypothetical protein LEP1GSC161_2771 [Leptospira santarosai str. CBC1416]|uniref:Uncharacterized protein n=4 Tax=Leptospira santarosai TaxID=28183 RepID=M6UZK5_9LEPT|nr:hypothetical protein LEP1GSC179_1381 [Leptospira santarosai str. MOR084]EKO78664.1 hypothetical protein LEP1GSC068_2194 [Leptospira sp. Fiocruz LV3954]EKR91521.1 hypothetical protein LEP1GSC163_0551 [Leptospira santarosai str. CBC379]EKS08018.1 hypothetical protein LEP1GSC071_2889 [Leptospira santarosai str. JET]EMF90133.1 hypothetical protein LEP1GSC005_3062 [Leptospira santarosai str. ST188]EMI69242.1 hypothetical protein LEP1GSC076_0399 [Leptospira sp. Fiocruz LV4135]EMJ47492.1 hypothet